MPLALQQTGPSKPLALLVQQRGRGHNKMPLKPVRKKHDLIRDFDAVYDLDPVIDEMEAQNAVAAFKHLPLTKDVEHNILTFVKRIDGN
jgi:hypothetical protein